ncbi:hypothetical protein K466DRAFT_659412 [Polyporus arcularius HHB13444]|uniref:Uncharacterized protein n=1 Tax=Polyporus arcularius HHB13444 TaxID=1314778 RepID=A0A5C3PRV5_9APHY|nr:hypothetical protein K466DRAFT_659412 [Polyporus arcularius HHB13444]
MNGSPASYHPLSATGRSPTLSRSEFMTNHDSSTESSNLPSPTLPGPDMTAEILRIACMRGDLSDLQERILHAVLTTSSKNVPTTTTNTLGGDAVLRLLFACLRTLGVDFTPALSALKSTAIHRCTRCTASFCAADNTPTACAVPHAPPLVSWDIELVADGVEPCETRYYPCCGKCVVVFPEQPEEDTDSSISMCYVGPHAASVPTPIADAEHEDALEHKFEGPRSDYGHADADAGKTHLQARLPSVQGQGHGQGYTPGTCVPRPEFGTDEGKPVSPRTATWVNAVKSAADQHQYHQQQHLGWGRPPVDMNGAPNSAEWTPPDPRDATMTQTIPWRQSSLYHPPGWIAIPPGLRRPGDSPFA